ncbi:hypothetical protein [Thermogymnomonas acidicola]|uniref:hypothetical protein n=1 Tax=Thermogymnomonas acidicola TaxID=399579 RepID=UPI001396B055|nr:hypothetical protein [Thermogymnomonas acidicola]
MALKGGVEAYSHYGSEALVWLSIESTDAFRSGKLPAGAREQLGNRYRRIQALLENLSSIQSMGEGHDLADTREFMYPRIQVRHKAGQVGPGAGHTGEGAREELLRPPGTWPWWLGRSCSRVT